MATIKAFIRSSPGSKKASIRIRLSDGRGVTYYGKTPIEISPLWWNPQKEEIKTRLLLPGDASREEINLKVDSCKRQVLDYYTIHRGTELPDDWITQLLSGKMKRPRKADNICDLFDNFVKTRNVSDGRRKHIEAVGRELRRFSLVNGVSYTPETFPDVTEFDRFLREEHLLQELHPKIYTGVTRVKPRGSNTVFYKLKILAAFFAHLRQKKLTRIDPLPKGSIPPEVYGEPVPLTKEELNHLLAFEGLSPTLSRARDMFCLQCFTGCRIGDFMALTRSNVQGDMLTYIPAKTAGESPNQVFVPLSDTALELINRIGCPDGYLVPRWNVYGKSGYNQCIKKLVEVCGIDRPVAVVSSLTRKPEMRMLSKIISTHTARKTFIHANYVETQDPALIAMMSGHSSNSRAFARYRNIDMDLLRRQIKKTFG